MHVIGETQGYQDEAQNAHAIKQSVVVGAREK